MRVFNQLLMATVVSVAFSLPMAVHAKEGYGGSGMGGGGMGGGERGSDMLRYDRDMIDLSHHHKNLKELPPTAAGSYEKGCQDLTNTRNCPHRHQWNILGDR